MSEAPANTSWYTYFPEDYRWSAAICGMISWAKWRGSEVGEIDQVGRRLAKKLGDDEHWFQEWTWMGDRVRILGRAEESKGHYLSAASRYQRSCCYYQMGERFRTLKDKKALQIYRRALDCFARFSRFIDRPRIERVEYPFERRKKLPAYLVHAENTRRTKPPAVIFFDGLDGTKELHYMWGIFDLVRRGISVFISDGPGTGEAIRFRGIPQRHDYEVAGSAALDYLETRSDVNARKTAIMAVSLGGYYASRIASMDKRFKACVAWGGQYGTTTRRGKSVLRPHLNLSFPFRVIISSGF